ncbi:YdcF family protein [Candidatus Woesearchaeota archaeon]|nr:YdcF family protein [Candidatus Woesearchaeota archaeon]
MNQEEIDKAAKKLWDYHHMNHKLEKADCILVLGSHDTRIAERGAQLLLEGWAPLLIYSGGVGRLTEGLWNKPEAEVFADIAIKLGVPKEKIIIENKSTNTGENIIFTMKILEAKKLSPDSFIVVQKPYMERRAFATFKKHLPDKKILVTSPQISFEDYPNGKISKDDMINIMAGDLQRIEIYPEKGFQIPQEIPEDVWKAYETLVKAGYDQHLIKE